MIKTRNAIPIEINEILMAVFSFSSYWQSFEVILIKKIAKNNVVNKPDIKPSPDDMYLKWNILKLMH